MTDELETLLDVARRLQDADIPYMVTGSFAMAFYAVPRMTRDIDIVISPPANSSGKIVKAFQNGYYVSESAVVEALQNSRVFNIISDESVVKVDLIIKKNNPVANGAFSHRRRVEVEGNGIYVTSKEDLIIAKLVWMSRTDSEMQEKDIRILLNTGCDLEYLRDNAAEAGVAGALNDILKNG